MVGAKSIKKEKPHRIEEDRCEVILFSSQRRLTSRGHEEGLEHKQINETHA